GVLDAARSDALNARLAAFDRDISNQVVVWVDKSLPPGQDVETFARQAFNAWGIGRKDKNNGVLGCELIGACGTRTSVRCWVVGGAPGAGSAGMAGSREEDPGPEHGRIVEAIRRAEAASTGQICVHVSGGRVRNVDRAAERLFHRLGMASTRDRNGVLIFVAA